MVLIIAIIYYMYHTYSDKLSVPEDIRKIERPRGTVVCDGRDGIYPVREKLSGGYWVDEDGKPHRPSRNGRVVGHIINGGYVPKEPDLVPVGDVDLKDWGNIELFDRLNPIFHFVR